MICAPDMSTSWRFASSRSPTPACSTGPRAGRSFFEQLIRDHLDVGRPRQVALDLRPADQPPHPGHVPHPGDHPRCRPADQLLLPLQSGSSSISRSTGPCAPRPSSATPATSASAGVSIAENWKALRAVGEAANQRLCDAQAADARPAPDVATFTQVTRPSTPPMANTPPGSASGTARDGGACPPSSASPTCSPVSTTPAPGPAVGRPAGPPYTSRQATYDLRRLKRKGLIVRLPHTHRYQLTPLGRRVAVLFTKIYGRVLAPGLVVLDPHLPLRPGRPKPPRHRLAPPRPRPRQLHQLPIAAA